MEIDSALKKLYSLHQFNIKLGLDNISRFLKIIGEPQKELKAFHLAGSNGKGSTAAFVASILRELGFDVGLYTSPHFVRFNERVKINGLEIPDSYISGFISSYEKEIDQMGLTFFEVTTALAFQYLYDKKVDYAVIETGLGGRLDATNVLNPLAVLITSISKEHTQILGDTVEKIAYEKAGIIKKNSKVFAGRLPEEAEIVIKKKCEDTGSELFLINDYTLGTDESLELYTEEIEIDNWPIPLKGIYQKYNAALAALAVIKTLDVTNFHPVEHGMRNVIFNTGIQGRYDYYKTSPDIIFDSAHNPESIKSFISEFQKDEKKYDKKVLLFGVMKDKAIEEMLSIVNDHFDEIHICQARYERALSVEEISKIAEKLNIKTIIERSPVEYLKNFERREQKDCLVILGSMYLIGDIKSDLLLFKSA
jgi:dihydrofolate synthase / folylpolyglutamate synthase